MYIEQLTQLTYLGQVKSELECIYACLTFFQCIQYNLNKLDGSCYLATSFNPINGVKNSNVVSKFIICKFIYQLLIILNNDIIISKFAFLFFY